MSTPQLFEKPVSDIPRKKRKNIRESIRKILLDKTDVGSNVFTNRASAMSREELPIISIYTKGEGMELFNMAPRELKRTLSITIEIVAKGSEQFFDNESQTTQKSTEDTLDDISDQVEREMSRDDTLMCTADESILTNIEFDFEGSGEQSVGGARLSYDVVYITDEPQSVLEQNMINQKELKNIATGWDIGQDDGEPDGTIDAIDKIEFNKV